MKIRKFYSVTLFSVSALLLLVLAQLFLQAGFDERRLFNPTPLHALSEWPGHLPVGDLDAHYIWQQQEVAGGIVYLYYYPLLSSPSQPDNTYCVGATFVAPENGFNWRSQAGNRLGCWEMQDTKSDFSPADITGGFVESVRLPYGGFSRPASEFMAYGFVGGNITPLTVAYGLAEQGQQVRIQWADGHTSYTPVKNGTFLQTYPANIPPERFELLDEQGITVASQSLAP